MKGTVIIQKRKKDFVKKKKKKKNTFSPSVQQTNLLSGVTGVGVLQPGSLTSFLVSDTTARNTCELTTVFSQIQMLLSLITTVICFDRKRFDLGKQQHVGPANRGSTALYHSDVSTNQQLPDVCPCIAST